MLGSYWLCSLARMELKRWVMCSLFLVAVEICEGQVTHHQTLYWVRYHNTLLFKPSVYWVNEADIRRFIGPDVANQFIMHSHVHKKAKRWDGALGLTYSRAYAAVPENGYKTVADEIRPFLEVNYDLPFGKVLLQQRFRLDNRFIQTIESQSVLEESIFIQRYRYRLLARIPLLTDEGQTLRLSVRVGDEIMLNHTGNTFDQNRIFVLFDYYLNKKISLETGYIYIYQQRFRHDDFFCRHVIRFSLFHRIARWESAQ